MKKYILAYSLIAFSFATNAQTTKPKAPVKPTVTVPTPPIDRSIRPSGGPAPELKLGKPVKMVLENGLKLFVVENHKVPKVSFSLVLDVDPVLEGDATGYVSLTGDLMKTGTTKRTKDQLDLDIDKLGANFSTSATSVSASCLSKYKENMFEIFSDVVLNPNFKQEELDKLKKQLVSGLQQQKDDPDAISANVTNKLIYGNDHPYGEINTEETVNKITIQHCKSYYATFFKPNVGYLAIVGDITPADAKAMVEKYLGSWKKGEVPKFTYPMPAPVPGIRVAFAEKKGAVQSSVSVVHAVNMKKNNPDLIAASVADNILGGGSSSRLFLNLRERHGWTYGAYSSLDADQISAKFNAYALVRNAVTDSAVSEILSEITTLNKEKVSNEELKNMLTYMTGTFALSTEDPGSVSRFAINSERYNLPEGYYNNYLKNLNNVSALDVLGVSNKYMHPKNTFIVIVGSKEVLEKMKRFATSGNVEMYDFKGDAVKESKPIPAGITATKVLDKYAEAIGGKVEIAKVKDVVSTYNGSMQGMTLEMTMSRKAPNKFSTSISANGMTFQKIAYNGVKGFSGGMQGAKDIVGKQLQDLKIQSAIFNETQYEKLGCKLKLTSLEELEGTYCYVVEVLYPSGNKSTEFYDEKTGLKIQEISENDEDGEKLIQTTRYKDYRLVGNLKFPYEISQSFGPATITFSAISIKVNTKLKDETFD